MQLGGGPFDRISSRASMSTHACAVHQTPHIQAAMYKVKSRNNQASPLSTSTSPTFRPPDQVPSGTSRALRHWSEPESELQGTDPQRVYLCGANANGTKGGKIVRLVLASIFLTFYEATLTQVLAASGSKLLHGRRATVCGRTLCWKGARRQ
eukprot:366299-Chlamydomonas_euryale.AAC.2